MSVIDVFKVMGVMFSGFCLIMFGKMVKEGKLLGILVLILKYNFCY